MGQNYLRSEWIGERGLAAQALLRRYVFIPAASSDSMEEMTSKKVSLENDTFINGLKSW